MKIYSILFCSAMVVCTILSAPMMFVSAQLLTITSINPKDYIYYLDNFLLDISVLALLATIFTTFVFLVSKNWRNMPHCQTLALIGSQGWVRRLQILIFPNFTFNTTYIPIRFTYISFFFLELLVLVPFFGHFWIVLTDGSCIFNSQSLPLVYMHPEFMRLP